MYKSIHGYTGTRVTMYKSTYGYKGHGVPGYRGEYPSSRKRIFFKNGNAKSQKFRYNRWSKSIENIMETGSFLGLFQILAVSSLLYSNFEVGNFMIIEIRIRERN